MSGRNIFQDLPGKFHLDWSKESKIVAYLPICDVLGAVRHTRLARAKKLRSAAKY